MPKLSLQPIVTVSGRTVVAYEALVRLDGTVTTDVLLASAGRGRARLEAAAVTAALDGLTLLGRDLRLSVNVSAVGLADHSVVDRLARDGGRLWVELTEDVPATRATVSVLHGLARAGAVVAVDDVGTSHADAALVAAVMPDVVKLSRPLSVALAAGRPWAHTYIADLRLAAPRSVLVAEGVEDIRGLPHLAAAGVDLVQGYATGRPACPADVFAQAA